MTTVKPQKAMELLTKQGPTPEVTWLDPKELTKARNPEEAAQYLVNSLRAALQNLTPAIRDIAQEE